MSNPAPTLNQINAFNATQGTTIDFNIIGGTEVIRSNKIYIYDLSDNSLICTHLYVSTESIHELPANTDSSIVYESGKSSADFVNGAQYYAQIQTFTDTAGTQGGSGLSIAKLFWCLPTPTLTLSTIPTTISTTSYNVSATYTPNTSGGATNEIQEFQFNLYSAIGALLQTSGVVLYGEGVDLSYNFSGLEVDSTYYVTLDVTTTQGMNVSAQSNTFTVSIDTPTMGSASVVNNGCDGYISVTSNLSSEYEHEESAEAGEIMSFTTDSVNDITELDVDFSPVQDGTPWMSAQDTTPYMFRAVPTQTEDFGHESDTIVGGTVGWNQLQINTSSRTVQGVTYTYNNGTVTMQGTATASSWWLNASDLKWDFITGHKYFIDVGNPNYKWVNGEPYWYIASGTFVGTPVKSVGIYSCTAGANTYLQFMVQNGKSVDAKFTPQVVDLTVYFGTTIADYVYTLEQGTAGAGVAWLRANAPQLFKYNAYDAGSLVSVSGLTSHDLVGKNQLQIVGNTQTKSGVTFTQSADGTIVVNGTATDNIIYNVKPKYVAPPDTEYTRLDNIFDILPNTNYILSGCPSTGSVTTYRLQMLVYGSGAEPYDIGSGSSQFSFSESEIASKNYRLCIRISSGTVCNNVVFKPMIRLASATDATFEPYTKHSYPLDSTLTLRGIPKLDANNKLYYDGDTYASDGTVTRKYGIVDLGTLNWSKDIVSDKWGFYINNGILTNARVVTSVNEIAHFVIAKYTPVITYGHTNYDVNNVIYQKPNGQVFIVDNTYNDASTFKTAMSGVYLVYELATPTTSLADPYTNPQIVDPSGTEQYVGSPIPVGHETTYQRICPISGWDSVEVDVVGKNLFDPSLISEWSGVSGMNLTKNADGSFTMSGTATGTNYQSVIIPLEAGTYTFTGCPSGGSQNTYSVYIDGTGISIYETGNGATFTLNSAQNVRFVIPRILAGTNVNGLTFKPQVELGSTATTYQPYQGTTYTSTFPKYKQQVSQDNTPYITKNIGDTYADTLTENLVGGTIAWNQSVPDTTTTHTISGSIASMNDAVAGNFESVVCEIDPVQDLHGYDKPWVGGSGKNIMPPVVGGTNNGVTATVNSDGSVTLSGTNTSGNSIFRSETFTLKAGTYIITGGKGDGNSAVYLDEVSGSASVGARLTITEDIQTKSVVQVYNGKSVNYTVYPMLRLASVTDDTYEPYENLCPITGWTGCEVSKAGVNLFDKAKAIEMYCDGSTKLLANTTFKSVYVPLAPNATYTYRQTVSGTYARFAVCNSLENLTPIYSPVTKTAGYETATSFTFTNTDFKYLICTIYRSTSDTKTYDEMANSCMLEFGSTATDYVPYNPNSTTYNITWQTEAGTVYGGSIDVVSGVLTVAGAKDTYDETASIGMDSDSGGYHRFYISNDNIKKYTDYTSHMKSNLCPIVNNYAYYGGFDGEMAVTAYSITSNPSNYVYIISKTISSVADLKTFLSNNPLEVWYELATPQTYQLDPVQVACLLGQNNVWCDTGNTTVTYPTNHSYQSLSTTHKYYKRINGVESISVGSDVVVDVGTDNIIDLTQMFGTTIADYIYNTEQSSSSGMGVKFFKSLFPSDDYDYNSGELISVNASAHVIKDANGNVVNTYLLDSDLVLRGIPKLDANNKLYYDGDVYEPDGSVTRKYGIVDLSDITFWNSNVVNSNTNKIRFVSGGFEKAYGVTNVICNRFPTNLSLVQDTITYEAVSGYSQGGGLYVVIDASRLSGDLSTQASRQTAFYNWLDSNPTYVVYELATTTTEQADPFEENQTIIPNGIEEYVVTEQGDVEMPVGHDSTYYATEVYGGTIDMAKGVLTIDMVSVDLGSLTWVTLSWGKRSASLQGVAKTPSSNAQVANLLAEEYATQSYESSASNGISLSVDGYLAITTTDAPTGQLVYELETPIEISLTPQQMQTLSGQNNIWSNTNGGMYLVYQLPITSLLVKRRDVADVSGKWLTLYSTPITQASDMDFTFIDFLNQYGKTYQYALVPVLAQDQSGVVVQIEGGYTVSDNVDSIFDGVYIADQTNVERVKAGVGYGNIDMNQGVGSITPIGSKYPIVITNSQNQYHNGSVRGTIVPNDFYSNGNLSRIDMVNKRDELEQFLTNKRAKIIKDWNGNIWLVMIMSNVACSFDDNYGMGMVSFSADWLEVGDPTNQQDLYNAGLINVGGV